MDEDTVLAVQNAVIALDDDEEGRQILKDLLNTEGMSPANAEDHLDIRMQRCQYENTGLLLLSMRGLVISLLLVVPALCGCLSDDSDEYAWPDVIASDCNIVEEYELECLEYLNGLMNPIHVFTTSIF